MHKKSQTLLVVEDHEMVRRLLIKILRLSGFNVLEAAHAREALELSDNHHGHIPLMVTDVAMPGMDGRALADAMAKCRPEMSVLFISGYADDPCTRKMLGERPDFLSKPFLPKTLVNKIREILEENGTYARLLSSPRLMPAK